MPWLKTIAISPWTDLAQTGPSIVAGADADPLLTEPLLSASAALYLNGHSADDPRASPLAAAVALPPLRSHVGSEEILLDDTLRLRARARSTTIVATAILATVSSGMNERRSHGEARPTNLSPERAVRAGRDDRRYTDR